MVCYFFRTIPLVLALLSSSIFHAQSKPLKVGEKIPELSLGNVINFSKNEIKLSDYKGKLIILDFWRHSCIGCIESFSYMDSLQKKFNNKIQIILVNPESKDSTERFFAKRKRIKPPNVPLITGDKLLSAIFPHDFVPHHVWIDSAGTVRYIVSANSTTFTNIEKFIKGKDLALVTKVDVRDINWALPFLADAKGRFLDKMEFYSSISNMFSATGFHKGIENGKLRLYTTSSILGLIKIAFGDDDYYSRFIQPFTLVLDVKDLSHYTYLYNMDRDTWNLNNAYTYDISVPSSREDMLYDKMKDDLSKYFRFTAKVIKKKVSCLALVRTNLKNLLTATPQKAEMIRQGILDGSIFGVHNSTSDDFVDILNRHFTGKINKRIINKTNFKSMIGIGLDKEVFDSMDLVKIKKELRKYGLDLIEAKAVFDVLVIKD